MSECIIYPTLTDAQFEALDDPEYFLLSDSCLDYEMEFAEGGYFTVGALMGTAFVPGRPADAFSPGGPAETYVPGSVVGGEFVAG